MGIGIALGSDVGAGAGLFMPKEALQAYFIQQLLGPDGLNLTPAEFQETLLNPPFSSFNTPSRRDGPAWRTTLECQKTGGVMRKM